MAAPASAEGIAADHLVPTSQQLVEGGNDLIAVFLQRPDSFAEILLGDGNNLERVQDDRLSLDPESRIEAGIGNFP
jgi:hypothetical protein